jgi:hypothetical protein
MRYKLFKQALPLLLLSLSFQHELAWSDELPDNGCSLATLKGNYNWDESTRSDYSLDGYLKFGAGWVFAVSVGKEVNDGNGHITAGQMTINNTFDGKIKTLNYTGVVTVKPNCVGTYRITISDGSDGGGGTIYIDPVSRNFTLLDEFNIGVAHFNRDGSSGKPKKIVSCKAN